MIGRTIGRYQIVSELGRGGMGVVYRATQTTLDRTVAIKMLSPHLADSGEHLARFRREADVLARLQHENIVHIYDVEEVEGTFCIVMEFVAGPSLGQVLHRERTLDGGKVREIGAQLAVGLEAAHRQGIVHRDLKPDNILFTPDGRPKITDFGIARIGGDDAMSRTRTGILMGTPYYMSPEQARGGKITGASDIYSLGVLLFQMLTGRVPFEGNDPISVAIKHMQEAAPTLRNVSGIQPELAALVDRTLQKEPTRRFASAGEMSRALRAIDLGSAPVELTWDPVPAPVGGASGDPLCPSCGAGVRVGFLTCPRCGETLSGLTHEAAPAAVVPVGGAVPGALPIGTAASGSGTPAARPAWAAWIPSIPWPAGLRIPFDRDRFGSELRRWIEPGGRWNVPPLLWVGIVVIALGLSLGLARNFLAGANGTASRNGSSSTTGTTVAATGGLGGGASVSGAEIFGNPRTGTTGTTGTVTTTPGGSGTTVTTATGQTGSVSGETTTTGPEATSDTPDSGTHEPPRTNPPEGPRTQQPEIVPEVIEENISLPPRHDLPRIQRDLEAVVERQRRATESGDEALFRRDLSEALANAAMGDLTNLHRNWNQIRSETWNLEINDSGEPLRFLVDFHTRLTGVGRGRSNREVIHDTHVYWDMEWRGGRWIIVNATSRPHEEETR